MSGAVSSWTSTGAAKERRRESGGGAGKRYYSLANYRVHVIQVGILAVRNEKLRRVRVRALIRHRHDSAAIVLPKSHKCIS